MDTTFSLTLVANALLKFSVSLFDISMNEGFAKDEQLLISALLISRYFLASNFLKIARKS